MIYTTFRSDFATFVIVFVINFKIVNMVFDLEELGWEMKIATPPATPATFVQLQNFIYLSAQFLLLNANFYDSHTILLPNRQKIVKKNTGGPRQIT